MVRNILIKTLVIFTFCLLLAFGCGKKIEKDDTSDGTPTREDRGIDPRDDLRVREFISKQTVTCEDENLCAISVAKIVVLDRKAVKFCTGTLINKNIVAIASSCLTRSLRVPGISCSQSVHVLFPETRYRNKKTVKCERIIQSDNNYFADSALLKADIALIELQEDVSSRSARFSDRGFEENSIYRAWKVTAQNDYDATIGVDNCSALFESYANPFVTNSKAPFMTVSGCDFKEGNLGAPLFDRSGVVRGIMSAPVSQALIDNLDSSGKLSEETSKIAHVSNFSCFSYPFNRDSVDPNCNISVSEIKLKILRIEMLDRQSVHDRNKIEIKNELEEYQRYFKWNVEFVKNESNDFLETHIASPKCIHRSASWLYEFKNGRKYRTWVTKEINYKNYVLKVKLDKFLKPVSVATITPLKSYFLSFSPSRVYFNRNTNLYINSSLFGEDTRSEHDYVRENCR